MFEMPPSTAWTSSNATRTAKSPNRSPLNQLRQPVSDPHPPDESVLQLKSDRDRCGDLDWLAVELTRFVAPLAHRLNRSLRESLIHE